MKEDCPFCGLESSAKVFATGKGCAAIYNLSPILPGHSLVVPFKHVTSLFELTEDEISEFFSFARNITAFLCEAFDSEAYDWSLQEGAEAGQSISHLHLHIIPRKPGDLSDNGDWYGLLQQSVDPENKTRIKLSDSEHIAITQKLRKLRK